jgi:hypothetical protein
MTHQELRAKAESHLSVFSRCDGLTMNEIRKFQMSKVTEAIIFEFNAEGREDKIRVTLEAPTGIFLGGEYSPAKKK